MSEDENDLQQFQEAVKGTRPLKFTARVQHAVTPPPPVPIPLSRDTGNVPAHASPSPASEPDNPFGFRLEETTEAEAHFYGNLPDLQLFQHAAKGVRPLKTTPRVQAEPQKPKPIPQQFLMDEMQALADSLSDHYIPAHEQESGEELLYLREGHSPDILRKLRRGHWVIQEQLDLHGLTAEEARLYVVEFLAHCRKRGARCVRIIHGKGLGSKNREPVLKKKLRSWLIQRDEVIAYAQAREVDGGSGALVVLLTASSK